MGLDLVETVISIEAEFEIRIPNEIAETLTMPGKVINYLMSLPKVSEKYSRDEVADIVWEILENECLIDRKDFTEDSRFVEDMGLD